MNTLAIALMLLGLAAAGIMFGLAVYAGVCLGAFLGRQIMRGVRRVFVS